MDGILTLLTITTTDLTLMVVFGFVFAAYFSLLNKVIFTPYLKLVEKREAQGRGAVEKAKSILEQSQKEELSIDQDVDSLRAALISQKNEVLQSARLEADKIISENAAKNKEVLEQGRKKIGEKRLALASAVEESATDLAKAVKERIISLAN